MMAFQSIGKKSLEQLRRLFLQYSSRTNATAIDLTISPANIALYSLTDSLSLCSGRHETSILEFHSCITKFDLRPTVENDDLHLFGRSICYEDPTIDVCDGLLAPATEVRDGSLNVHPAMSSQVLLSLQAGGHAQSASISFGCKAVMPLDGRALRRFSKGVQSASVTLKRPKVLREQTSSKVFGEAKVRDVPASIQVETPLIRVRESPPGSDLLSNVTAWMPEKKLLAGVVGGETTSADIQIIGVFRRVPIRSVVRIEIGPGPGNLSLYLRPKCGNMVQSANRPMFSIAFGRVRGKKEVVRALIPE